MYIVPMYSKELLKGITKPLILNALNKHGWMYGYQITRQIEQQSGGKILIKEGSLYPILHALLQEGVLEVRTEYIGNRLRKYYKVSKKGGQAADAIVGELNDFLLTLQHIFNPHIHRAL